MARKKKEKKSIFRAAILYVSILLMAVISLFPFLSVFLQKDIRDIVYRQYVYTIITDEIKRDSNNSHQIMEAYFDYIYDNIFANIGNETPNGSSPLNTLVRGIGWCDQQAFLLGLLLSMDSLEGCSLWLKTHHTVTSVFLRGQNVNLQPLSGEIVDPLNGIIYKDKSGKIATYNDLYTKRNSFTSRRLGNVESDSSKKYLEYFKDQLPAKLWQPVLWEVGKGRQLLRHLLSIYQSFLGKHYFNLYQDLYLSVVKEQALKFFELNIPEDKMYYKARNYQLCGRFDKACKVYREFCDKYSGSKYRDRACLFEAASLMKLNKWEEASRILEQFINNDRKSDWMVVAEYYMSWCNYRLGKGQFPQMASDVELDSYYFN